MVSNVFVYFTHIYTTFVQILNLRFLSLFSAVLLLMLLLNFSGARRPIFAESSGDESEEEETAIKEEYHRPSFSARGWLGNKISSNACSADLNVDMESVAFHVANYVLDDTPPQGKLSE